MIGWSAMRPLVVQKWTIDSSKTETSFLLLISTLRKTATLEKTVMEHRETVMEHG